MGVTHTINIVTATKFNTDNLHRILQAGSELGFIYYDQTNDDHYFNPPIINSEQATNLIMNMSKELIEDGRGYIYTRIDDTFVSLSLRNEDGDISLDFLEASYPWRKEFWAGSEGKLYGFDAARYIRVMLKLCEDFKIKKLAFEKI